MIVVRVEKHHAVTHEVTLLGTAVIVNDGTGDAHRGNYQAFIGHRGADELAAVMGRPARSGRVAAFPRQRQDVWRLLLRALRSAIPDATPASDDPNDFLRRQASQQQQMVALSERVNATLRRHERQMLAEYAALRRQQRSGSP